MGITYRGYLGGLPMGITYGDYLKGLPRGITYGDYLRGLPMAEKSFKPQLKLGCG
jgi:hypothetical protein